MQNYRKLVKKSSKGTTLSMRVNLTLAGRLKPQLHNQNPPARVWLKLDIPLVRAGGLGFYSRVSVAGRDSVLFQSPGLKLTPMDIVVPLQDSYAIT
jgi:hypothetical protein